MIRTILVLAVTLNVWLGICFDNIVIKTFIIELFVKCKLDFKLSYCYLHFDKILSFILFCLVAILCRHCLPKHYLYILSTSQKFVYSLREDINETKRHSDI